MSGKHEDSQSGSDKSGNGGAVLFFGVLAMIGLMIGSIYYPYPSGNTIGVWNFVALWFRELLLLVPLLLAAIVWGAIRLWKLVRNWRGKNAP